jgi:proline iminopeptidase
MSELYPETDPYEQGMLEVGDGHSIYWETSGAPDGKPALILHGGPGSGLSAGARRYFDPARYRIIGFDQRGCGRSTPHVSAPHIDLSTNTTAHLLSDIELLRQYLGVERWLVLGGSWGSTLALAYAQRHPGRVTELVLHSVATTSQREIEWITVGAGAFFPEAWQRFREGAGEVRGSERIIDAYHRLLINADPDIRMKAARNWCDWEMAVVAVNTRHKPHPRYADPAFRLGFARLVTHYWRHRAWLEDGVLIRQAGRLAHIPGILIHGRLDISGPLITPWELSRRWPGSRLVVIDEAGHDSRDAGFAEAIVAATDEFSRQWRKKAAIHDDRWRSRSREPTK